MTTREQIIANLEVFDHEQSTEHTIFGAFKNGLGQYWPVRYSKNHLGEWHRSVIRDRNPFKTIAGLKRYIKEYKARYKFGNPDYKRVD